MSKKIELFEGFSVELNEQLLDDFDFISDLNLARKENDSAEMVSMYFALIGGEETYTKVRKHIEEEKGYFSQTALLQIIDKVTSHFPKVGNRAQRRSWEKTSN